MVTISDSTMRNNIFETVYDLINVATSTYNTSSVAELYGGYPDTTSMTFPCIIINPINVGEEAFTVDTTRSVSTKTVLVVVDLFAKKNKDLDIMSDGVTNTLRTVINGLTLVSVGEDYGFISPNDSKIKTKTLSFNFVRR